MLMSLKVAAVIFPSVIVNAVKVLLAAEPVGKVESNSYIAVVISSVYAIMPVLAYNVAVCQLVPLADTK